MTSMINLTHSLLLAAAAVCAPGFAAAQSSLHRADFDTSLGDPVLAAITIGTDETLSVFIDAAPEIEVATARLRFGSEQLVIPLTGGFPRHGEVAVSATVAATVRSGSAFLELGTSEGLLDAAVVDPGLASYGAGGSPSGPTPTLHGIGHAVAEGTIIVVANGLTPGRLGGFVFGTGPGSGTWAPGVPNCVASASTVELRVPDASGRVEWRVLLPPTVLEGASLCVQYVELDGGVPSASTNGVRVQVRRATPVFVEEEDGRIVTRLASGLEIASATIGSDGLADPDTQSFFDQTPANGWETVLSSAVMGHPALNVATAPLYGHVEPGSTGLSLADEGQRGLIGGLTEIFGIWSLGWVTDGCSGIWFKTKFEDCCDLHDMLYSIGGNEADREAADLLLAQCVAERTGNVSSVNQVYTAVQAHGKKHFNYHGPPAPL